MFLFQRLTLYLQTKLEKMIAVKHVKLICCLLIRRYEIKQLNVKQYEYTIILFPGMSKKNVGVACVNMNNLFFLTFRQIIMTFFIRLCDTYYMVPFVIQSLIFLLPIND